MKKMALCEMSKPFISNNLDQLFNVITDCKYFCTKCVRVANDKGYLCKPVKISKIKP